MALVYNEFIFDEMVYGTTPVYTNAKWNAILAQADVLTIHAIVTEVSGTSPTITVLIEMSGDNRNWGSKGSGTAEINAQALTANQQNEFLGKDTNTTSGLGFYRLKVTLGGSSPQARIRLYVAGRVT